MKKADDIIKEVGEFNYAAFQEKYRNKPSISITEAVAMINKAREEAIEACAEIAYEEAAMINAYEAKQLILSLKDELE
jgi:hypothetical protein